MKSDREERLPQVVEDRMQEAYAQIRKGEVKQMKNRKTFGGRIHAEKETARRRRGGGKWLGMAAAVYYQKTARQEGDTLNYEFELNYELVPGEYRVVPGYLPKNYQDDGDGKYRSSEDDGWITVMPVYTTAQLDRLEGEITIDKVEKVDHTELSGMPADVVTLEEAEKYQRNTYVFLFGEEEGYVLALSAGYSVDGKELLKFADSLTVERIGDGRFETEEEKQQRQQAQEEEKRLAAEGEKRWDALMELGIPEEKLFGVGEELLNDDGSCGYTVTGYAFLESLAGFEEDDFFDFSRFDGWLKEDGTLRPYTRMHYDKNGELLEEKACEQEILSVEVKVHCYEDRDVPTDLTIQRGIKTPEGHLTWAEDYYEGVPEEQYFLQMDNSAVYFDGAVNRAGESRSHFFWREMKAGEEFACTLLFVVDKDREDEILLYPTGSCNDLWQTESMTAEEIRDGLEGYIRLAE